MKKYLVLLVVFFLTSSHAADEGWWIYTYEDVSTLKAVFNYLAMIKTDDSYLSLINVVVLAGLTATIIFKFLDVMAIPKYFLSVVGTMLVVFSVNATVHIVNVKSFDSLNPKANNYAVVDNVPYIFAVLSSAFSNVGYNTALLIETIFTSIANGQNTMEASFLKSGNLGAFKILEALDSIDPLTINEDGKNFSKEMQEYLHYCVYSIAYALDSGLSSEISTRPDLFEYLDPVNTPNKAIQNIATQKVIASDGAITTCSTLYNKAKTTLSKIKTSNVLYNTANSILYKITNNVNNAGSVVTKMMNGIDDTGFANPQAQINNYIMTSGVMKAFENSWRNYGISVSSSQAGFGSGLSQANIQMQGKVKAKAASSMMPSIHSVLQAVMYVLFPLVLIVQLFAGGFFILKNYIMGLLWLEMWIPSYSVLNYFTLREAQEQALDKMMAQTSQGDGIIGYLTLSNQNEIYNTIANQAAIAADFYIVGVPAIAGFILFASFQALAGITSGVAGTISQFSSNPTLNQERAKIAAFEEVDKQQKLNNPLYTGNIGTVEAQIATSSALSSASKAAGEFLGSGASFNNLNNLTRANMFQSMESSASLSNREYLLSGNGGNLSSGINTAVNNSSIQAGKDSVSAANLKKQMEALGENQSSAFLNSARIEDLKTNIVSPVAVNGETINKVVGGGATTSVNTENGKVTQTSSESGKIVQSNTDGSFKENYNKEYQASNIEKRDNVKTADNTDTADTLISRNYTDTANNKKERNNTEVYTTDNGEKVEAIIGKNGEFLATKVTQTTKDGVAERHFDKDGNLVKASLDGSNKYSGMKTNEYTDKNGLAYKEYLNENGKAVGRTVTEYSNNGYFVKDQRLNENGEWEDIRKNRDGSDKTDISTVFKNNKTHEEMTTKDTSITLRDNYTLEAKNAWDAFNINQRINGKDAMDSYRQTMDSIAAGATVKNWGANPIGAVTDIYSIGKSYVTNSNLQDGDKRVNFEPDENTYLKDRTENFFNFGKENK